MAKDGGDATARLAPSKAVSNNNNSNAKAKKISERLEEDAQEMEARLQQLRLNLLEEKKKREKALPLKHAGNRWRSAREDRGSVSRYASDVQTRQAKSKSQQPESGDKGKKSRNKARECQAASCAVDPLDGQRDGLDERQRHGMAASDRTGGISRRV